MKTSPHWTKGDLEWRKRKQKLAPMIRKRGFLFKDGTDSTRLFEAELLLTATALRLGALRKHLHELNVVKILNYQPCSSVGVSIALEQCEADMLAIIEQIKGFRA